VFFLTNDSIISHLVAPRPADSDLPLYQIAVVYSFEKVTLESKPLAITCTHRSLQLELPSYFALGRPVFASSTPNQAITVSRNIPRALVEEDCPTGPEA
jgi:hypothetical protein